MSGLAALRSGAGLVTLMLPESLRADLAGKIPELMTVWLPETAEGTPDASAAPKVIDQLSLADVVVVGPGLSTGVRTQELVREVVRKSPVAVVLDTDGINAFASQSENHHNEAGFPIIITPHPGEMARLLGSTIPDIQRNRIGTASAFAAKRNVFTVLKGFQTLVATPAGQILVNSTGNPGMATGGTGDILSGIMGRFVAGWSRKYRRDDVDALADSVAAAVFIHGLAGDIAARESGEESLIATDLVTYLPKAFQCIAQE
jgi:NAD(P)H-hydrate epimerase